MGSRTNIKTTKKQIVDYWDEHVSELDVSIDFSEAHERCWRCGYEERLHRCHIIPDSCGGKDEPSNFVLLCHRCHREAPNIDDVDFFWDWLYAQKTGFYDTYWHLRALKEFEVIYGRSFFEIAKELNITEEHVKLFSESLDQNNFSSHWGDGGKFNTSTYAGIFVKLIKSFPNGKELLNNIKSEKTKLGYGDDLVYQILGIKPIKNGT